MMFSLVNIILLIALVVTSVCVTAMYLKLRRLSSYHVEYKRILDQTAAALVSVNAAVQALNHDGKSTLIALGERIDEARTVLSDIRTATKEGDLGTVALKSVDAA
ncbi:hypothetical protein [Microvirga puerhi]|uniref:Chemotaxis protein n=1 Tax=Microvirga puerhi TaxID=2876078 RepID=A0ABS7VUV3_9HYPH|nr:hypothetical protein [Microvirga puerhi]MBZ6079349.1 hypothetical protein [Microvirga puerhi]